MDLRATIAAGRYPQPCQTLRRSYCVQESQRQIIVPCTLYPEVLLALTWVEMKRCIRSSKLRSRHPPVTSSREQSHIHHALTLPKNKKKLIKIHDYVIGEPQSFSYWPSKEFTSAETWREFFFELARRLNTAILTPARRYRRRTRVGSGAAMMLLSLRYGKEHIHGVNIDSLPRVKRVWRGSRYAYNLEVFL